VIGSRLLSRVPLDHGGCLPQSLSAPNPLPFRENPCFAGDARCKSQGSEYPAVVIPIMTQHYAMLQRNLLYTGVTRGKRLVVLVGQKKAIAIAVRNVSGRRRWSKLAEWLRPKHLSHDSLA